MAHLTLVLDNREVRKFALNKGVTTIGRAQENDIVINNLALSRNHAQVETDGARFKVTDLRSQNGVFVNGKRITRAKLLKDKDSITLGTYQFLFSDGESERGAGKKTKKKKAQRPKARAPSPETRTLTEESSDEDLENVPLLVLKYNDVELQRFPLRGSTCMIGRAKECEVQVAERRLSRRHCQIFKGEGGRFFLKDMGSQNGTYVNRKKIRGFFELGHGDIINFAEYSIHYLSDIAEYHGPDAEDYDDPRETMAPPGSDDDADETVMPPAYSDDYGYVDNPARAPGFAEPMIRPVDMTTNPEDSGVVPPPPMSLSPRARNSSEVEPLIRSPAEARKRKPATKRPDDDVVVKAAEPKKKKKKKKKKAKSTRRTRDTAESELGMDVPDRVGVAKADSDLDDWYSSRNNQSQLYDALPDGDPDDSIADSDSMVFPTRGGSSVSRVLSTMMVGKRELDRNLKGDEKKVRERRFVVDVRHKNDRIFSGPLTEAVTILGKSSEADIQLQGRYVAGRHSLLVRVRDSLLLVRLGSSSAARVNGLPKLQAFLKSGDVIQIDETTIKISEE